MDSDNDTEELYDSVNRGLVEDVQQHAVVSPSKTATLGRGRGTGKNLVRIVWRWVCFLICLAHFFLLRPPFWKGPKRAAPLPPIPATPVGRQHTPPSDSDERPVSPHRRTASSVESSSATNLEVKLSPRRNTGGTTGNSSIVKKNTAEARESKGFDYSEEDDEQDSIASKPDRPVPRTPSQPPTHFTSSQSPTLKRLSSQRLYDTGPAASSEDDFPAVSSSPRRQAFNPRSPRTGANPHLHKSAGHIDEEGEEVRKRGWSRAAASTHSSNSSTTPATPSSDLSRSSVGSGDIAAPLLKSRSNSNSGTSAPLGSQRVRGTSSTPSWTPSSKATATVSDDGGGDGPARPVKRDRGAAVQPGRGSEEVSSNGNGSNGNNSSNNGNPSERGTMAIAKPMGYQAQESGEISFDGGERISLIRHVGGNTWLGRTEDGQEGTFPVTAVDLVKDGKSNSPRGAAVSGNYGNNSAAAAPAANSSAQPAMKSKKSFLKDKIGAMAEKTLAATKSAAAAAKTKTLEAGSKALQRAKEMTATRATAVGKERDDKISALHFVFEDLLSNPEVDAFVSLLMNSLVRPHVLQVLADERRAKEMQPVVLKPVSTGKEILVDPERILGDDEVRTLFAHLSGSLGIEMKVKDDAGLERVRASLLPFVTFLCDEKRDIKEVSRQGKAHLMLRSLGSLHQGMFRQQTKATIPGRAVLLCMMVLSNGGLYSSDVFRTPPEDDDLETVQTALDAGLALPACSCVAAGFLLLEWLKQHPVFSSYEMCLAASYDTVKREEMIEAMPSQTQNLLIFLCVFFRLFRHFTTYHGLSSDAIASLLATVIIADPVDPPITTPMGPPPPGGGDVTDFVAALMAQLPSHPICESAIGLYVRAQPPNKAKGPAVGKIVSYDFEKKRYLCSFQVVSANSNTPTEQQTYVKEGSVEWLHYGRGLPEIPHLSALLFASFSPPLVEGGKLAGKDKSPIALIEQYMRSASSSSTPATAKPSASTAARDRHLQELFFRNNCEVSVSLLRLLAGDTTHKQSILATGKALTQVFLYRGREELFITHLIAHFVGQEVTDTQQLATLFRSNSTASRVLSSFVGTACRDLLNVLQVPLQQLAAADRRVQAEKAAAAKKAGSSVDADGNADTEEEENFPFVAVHARAIMEAILNTGDSFPNAMRKVLTLVGELAEKRFVEEPNARSIAVGGVVFLRFFGPAILSPVDYGLNIDGGVTPSLQRLLVLITSAVTVLANQTAFSQTKPSKALNQLFVDPMRPKVQAFLDMVGTERSGGGVVASSPVSQEQFEEALIALVISAQLFGLL